MEKKTKKKSLLRRINNWLHLWLGLVSGLIVFVVSLTGAIYTFQKEIKDLTERWRFVDVRRQPFVTPSALLAEAQKHFPEKKPTGITYAPANQAAAVGFQSRINGDRSFSVVFLNPYDAGFIKKKTRNEGAFDFFDFILDGHRALWLPYKIGRPVVGVAVLVFMGLLFTGLVMWWPKKWKRKHLKSAFKIKLDAKPKRLNYDLHNVLGFYSLLVALVLALTGLVWSFEWVEKGVYWLSSAGKAKAEYQHPHSDSTLAAHYSKVPVATNLDRAWQRVMAELKTVAGGMYLSPRMEAADDPIEIVVYKDYGNFYNRNEYLFDQYTLKPLRTPDDRFATAAFADKLSMMNYDIHVGAVLGLPGKILVFLAGLICASLPVTGFIVWWNKGRKWKP